MKTNEPPAADDQHQSQTKLFSDFRAVSNRADGRSFEFLQAIAQLIARNAPHKGSSHSVIRLLLSNCFAISVRRGRRRKSAPQMGVFPHAVGIFPQSLRNISYNYSGLTSTATGSLSAALFEREVSAKGN
jgi:hypothetical protein